MTTATTTHLLLDEFRRVFGSGEVAEDGSIYADGWPSGQHYIAARALPVLDRFADGYGISERGDAEICAALEEAGALIYDGCCIAVERSESSGYAIPGAAEIEDIDQVQINCGSRFEDQGPLLGWGPWSRLLSVVDDDGREHWYFARRESQAVQQCLTPSQQAAADAIERSVEQNEIVTIDHDPEVASELLALCDDNVNVEADGVTEYWGTSDDGGEWRVHMRAEA